MTAIFDQWAAEFRHLIRHRDYHQTDTQEDPVSFALIDSIENALSAAGHEVSDVLHGILAQHLTVGNVLAHAGQWAQNAESSPLLQTVERFALGPAGEATVAKIVQDVAGLLQAQAAPVAPNLQAGAVQPAEPAPAQ